jgi:hypothetical protein
METHLLRLPGERLPSVAPGRGGPPGRLGMLSWQQGGKNTNPNPKRAPRNAGQLRQ